MERKYPLSTYQIKCIYRMMLMEGGEIFDLDDIFSLYEDYDDVKNRSKKIRCAPSVLQCLPNLVMPKYLKFMKDHLVEGKTK